MAVASSRGSPWATVPSGRCPSGSRPRRPAAPVRRRRSRRARPPRAPGRGRTDARGTEADCNGHDTFENATHARLRRSHNSNMELMSSGLGARTQIERGPAGRVGKGDEATAPRPGAPLSFFACSRLPTLDLLKEVPIGSWCAHRVADRLVFIAPPHPPPPQDPAHRRPSSSPRRSSCRSPRHGLRGSAARGNHRPSRSGRGAGRRRGRADAAYPPRQRPGRGV